MDDHGISKGELSLASGLGLHRKIKVLSGQSPSVFLLTIQFKRASDFLSTKSDNVSQIAYSVGFSSLSYFNKCFKEQFGVTPGEFAKSNKAKP